MTSKTLVGRLALAGCLLIAATQIGRAQSLPATLSDIGPTPPTPGAYDQYMTNMFTVGGVKPGGLNYFWDNSAPPGQTFATGSNPGGYVLNSVAVQTGGGGGSDGAGSYTYTQPYYVRIYALSGGTNITFATNNWPYATPTNATLVASYVSQAFSFVNQSNWLQMTGLNVALAPNAQYAYTFGRSLGGYENLANVTGNLYTNGQVCLINTGGGANSVNYGTIGNTNVDADFDVGLNLPAALTINPPIMSPASPVTLGSTVNFTAGTVVDFDDTGVYTYQWQTDGGSGGTLTNIPGATSPTLNVNTTGFNLAVNYQYAVVAVDSSLNSVTSAPAVFNVITTISGALADIGTTAPTVGGFDISQLVSGPRNSGNLNYYDNNGTPPGQTFTTLGNPKGYSFGSLALQLAGGNNGTTGPTSYSGYDLFLFSVSADGTTATLMADVTNLNFAWTYGHWLQWTFPPITLNSNANYAYTFHRRGSGYAGLQTSGGGDVYPGGAICLIPSAGGAVQYSTTAGYDQTFDVGLIPLGLSIIVNNPTATPNPVYARTPVTLADSVLIPATGSFTYRWLTDDGSGATPPNYIAIPGATATNLTVIPADLNPGGADYTTNFYFVANVGASSATSAPVTLTVHAASLPQFTAIPTPTNLVTFVGQGTLTYSVGSVFGTLPITNQWLANTGSGFSPLTGNTNTTLTLTNLQLTSSGSYEIASTNIVGTSNAVVMLTVLPAPPSPLAASQTYFNMVFTNHPWAYWRLNETNDPNLGDNPNAPTFTAYDYSGHGFDPVYGSAMTVSNAGPSSLTPGFPGFDNNELAAGTINNTANGYMTVPGLNLTGNTNLTFMFWMYPNGAQATSAGFLFNRGGPDNAAGFCYANTADHLGYTWNQNSQATYNWDSGLVVPENNWNFVAYVITPTNCEVYLGNIFNGTTNFSQAGNPIAHQAETFNGGTSCIGSDSSGVGRAFTGYLSEMALFTNALSTAQIQQYFLTGIGASALAATVAPTTVSSGGSPVYSGQNVILSSSVNGSAPVVAQWQAGPDGSTWTNVPGATGSTLVVNPIVPPGGATIYYQLTASNVLGSVTNSPVSAQFTDLPVTPPGLWTINFQYTNNIGGPNQIPNGGLGSYVGRGILGNGMFWNKVPAILTGTTANYNSGNYTSVSSLADDGATGLGINCLFNNGGNYNGIGTLASPYNPLNLTEQWFRGYGETYFDQYNYTVQLTSVPDGTYNVACYGGSGITSQGSQDLGSTFIIVDPVNGNQTNITACPSPVSSLQQGVNFVIFTHVHVGGGTLNVSVTTNNPAETTDSYGTVSAVQLQLVSYDPLVASFKGTPTNAFVGQAVTFNNTSTGYITNSVWSFGDGISVTNASNASVSHSYAAVGTYPVSLKVTGPGGSSSTNLTSYINIYPSLKVASAYRAGGQLILTGANGPVGTQFRVLTATNLLSGWTTLFTGVVAADGSYNYTNSALTNSATFFRLVSP